MITSNISSIKNKLTNLSNSISKTNFKKNLKKEIENEIKKFSTEFQAKYFEIAFYYYTTYKQNLEKKTIKILESIINGSIFNAFIIIETNNNIEIKIKDDLAFFIGALEYGTKEIQKDLTFTKLKKQIINRAHQKFNNLIKNLK